MRFVSSYGMLYRLSEQKYLRYLRLTAQGTDADLDALGKCIGSVENVTELSRDGAQMLLEIEQPRKKESR